MKSYAKGRGWLFPLVGGPHNGVEYRLGWNRENTIEAALEELPLELELVGGVPIGEEPKPAVYKPEPAFYKSGKNKGQQKLAKADGEDVPAIQYVWVCEPAQEEVNDG